MFKIGDLVKLKGETARILVIDGDYMSLSGFGWISDINKSDLELVESVVLPQLKDGDLVYVHDIPSIEKAGYGTNWVDSMSQYVTTEVDFKIGKVMAYPVTNVRRSDCYGPLVNIGGYAFQTYHLEPVNTYDII